LGCCFLKASTNPFDKKFDPNDFLSSSVHAALLSNKKLETKPKIGDPTYLLTSWEHRQS
jgi:hypothetical protein